MERQRFTPQQIIVKLPEVDVLVGRMKNLERENAQQKKLVSDLALDKAILQEASKLTF